MGKEIEYTQTNVYFPLGILSDMDEEAKKEEMSRSEFIRYLFKTYQRREKLEMKIETVKQMVKEVKMVLEEAG